MSPVQEKCHFAEPNCSNYYDAFVSIQRGLFNTRDRAEHTRKRKTVSHTFSTKSVGQFEQYMHYNLQELVKQWDRLSSTATSAGQEYAAIDSLHWFNYLAFDIIGDLVRSSPPHHLFTNHNTSVLPTHPAYSTRPSAPPLACSPKAKT